MQMNMIEMVTIFGIFHYIFIYIMDIGFMIVIVIALLGAMIYVNIAKRRNR